MSCPGSLIRDECVTDTAFLDALLADYEDLYRAPISCPDDSYEHWAYWNDPEVEWDFEDSEVLHD